MMKPYMVYPSDIANYIRCPWLVYNRKVLRIYNKATSSQAMGLFEHEARRRFYTLLRNHIKIRLDEGIRKESIQSIAKRSIEESIPYIFLNYGFPHSTRIFKKGFTSRLYKECIRIAKILDQDYENVDYFLPFATEVSLRSPKLRLAGRIDCLLSTVDGIIPVDFKTDPGSIETLPYELQIAAYVMLVEEAFNCEVNYGLILYTVGEFSKIVQVTEKHRAIVKDIIDSILEMLETGKVFDSKFSTPHCSSCHFKRNCGKDELTWKLD